MAKRVKHVFGSCDNIVHLWAHQQLDWARGGRAGFEGPYFMSYSTVIAAVTKTKTGETAYLITDYHYSQTTSQHQWAVRRAIPDRDLTFVVPALHSGHCGYGYVSDNHRENFDAMVGKVTEKLKAACGAREPKRTRLILEAHDAMPGIARYFDHFDCQRTLPSFESLYIRYVLDKNTVNDLAVSPPALNDFVVAFPAMIEGMRAKYADGVARRREGATKAADTIRANRARRWEEAAARSRHMTVEEYRAALEAERAENERVMHLRYEERVEEWLAGKSIPAHLLHESTLLRVSGDQVETSRGAVFPLAHAKRGLALVRSVMARGEEWLSNGHTCKLGYYGIERIDADGTVHAGCHVVPWASIERIVPQIEAAAEVEVAE